MADHLKPFVTRLLSVRGRDRTNRPTAGAGFLVSERHILTCAHVVCAALDLPLTTPSTPAALVELDIIGIPEQPPLEARVIFWQAYEPDKKGDIAVLELVHSVSLPGSRPHLHIAQEFWGHRFRAFGFPSNQPRGVWAHGMFLGRDSLGWVHIESEQTTGYRVQPGFSGGPVWDETLQAVVGIVALAEKQSDVKAAFMIPFEFLGDIASVLNLPPGLSVTQPKDHKLPESVYIAPLGRTIPLQPTPSRFDVPQGYYYLGQIDDSAGIHFYRAQDQHIAVLMPGRPGLPAFLIDKYAITCDQFSHFLNELTDQGVVSTQVVTNGEAQCIGKSGQLVAVDAQARWQTSLQSTKPALPWGLCYQASRWQPLPDCVQLPVTQVTWWGAYLYGLWAHGIPIEIEQGSTFLPSCQQWQSAAVFDPALNRSQLYPWGEPWHWRLVNHAGYWARREIHSSAGLERWWASNPGVYEVTRPLSVSALPEAWSPIGCAQMLGNVWEWCADEGEVNKHAIKGGACNSPQEYCAPGYIEHWRSNRPSEYIGFRCAFTL